MNIRDLRFFHSKIKQLDNAEEIVKINIDEKKIWYSDKIKQHRQIQELTNEEIVRAYLILKLIKIMKYPIDCIELEKTHTIGRREKKTSARIDVLVKKPDRTYNTFMIVEVKAPDEYDREMEEIRTQLFQVARLEEGTQYLIYYTAYVLDEDIRERIVSISLGIFNSYKDWENQGKPNLLGIPPEYGIIKKPVFTKGGTPDLRKDVTKGELERVRSDLHQVLWGGGRYVGNEIFNFIMKLFLAKIYDEKETREDSAYQFQIFYEDGKSESAEKTTERVNGLYKEALKRYLHFPPDEVDKRDVRKIGDKSLDYMKVKAVVESFQDKSLTENLYDILGDFFERFLWNEFKQSKGQFFTHPNVVNFIIQGLSLGEFALQKINDECDMPHIIDPACGSGTFLIESMKTTTKYVLKNRDKLQKNRSIDEFLARNFPDPRKHAWAESYIHGIDFNEDLAMASKVNMVMHGDGSGNIESEDALSPFGKFSGARLKRTVKSEVYSKPVNEQFDVILSNPPFSITLAKETREQLSEIFAFSVKESSETLFIERWFQLLKPRGRLGVVLPETIFTATDTENVRLMIYRFFKVKSVISLPYLTFQPYTSTKTSLLFAEKKTTEEIKDYDKVWEKYREEFRRIKKEIIALRDTHADVLDQYSNDVRERTIKLIKRYLVEHLDSRDEKKALKDILTLYEDQLDQIDENWWVLYQTAQEFDYPILMYNVEEIGYKRLKSRSEGEEARPNELYTVKDNEIVWDTKNPQTLLDYMKARIKWD